MLSNIVYQIQKTDVKFLEIFHSINSYEKR